MGYEIQLDVFQGPIDLLLTLITKRRVDIYDVPLAAITDEYIGAVADMRSVDLETATGFLVVASALLELKSARLLPRSSEDESQLALLEQRDLLLARLLECATYRAAGGWMDGQLKRGEARYARALPLPPDLAVSVAKQPLALPVADLTAAAVRALAPRPNPEIDTSYIPLGTASVRDAIAEVGRRLVETGSITLVDLCPPHLRRGDVVVRFLALLELYKAGAVALEQTERFGDIRATWTGDTEVGDVLEVAEEYALEEGA